MHEPITRRLGLAAEKFGAIKRAMAARKARFRRPVEMALVKATNAHWADTARGTRLTFARSPIIRKTDKVFTMGSCFAREISYVLRDTGFRLFPRYSEIDFDKATQKPFKIKRRNHMNHYNTFTIRYEFEHAFANTHYGIEDFIKLPEPLQSDRQVWQDPYRRQIYAVTDAALLDLSRKIGQCIRHGVLESDVYVITLGLTEVWRNNANGRVFNQLPFGADDPAMRDNFTFVQSGYQENYENMRWVCAQILERFPERKIIVTVSPVALRRTFSGSDVITANTESKSILRAVAGALHREFPNVVYWPSYEIAMAQDVYEDDGRHVTPAGVKQIVDQFVAVHLDHA